MSEQCIEIFRPVQSSKLHRHWVALVSGVELSGDSEKEVQEKAIAFVLSDPIIKAEVSEREVSLRKELEVAQALAFKLGAEIVERERWARLDEARLQEATLPKHPSMKHMRKWQQEHIASLESVWWSSWICHLASEQPKP